MFISSSPTKVNQPFGARALPRRHCVGPGDGDASVAIEVLVSARSAHDLPGAGSDRVAVASVDPVDDETHGECSLLADVGLEGVVPDVIVMNFAGSPDEHAAAVVRGSADMAWDYVPPSPAVMSSLRTQHASLLQENPIGGTEYLGLNTRVAPFDDVRVRRALNFAVDRKRLMNLRPGRGFGRQTCQPCPEFLRVPAVLPLHGRARQRIGRWTGPDLERCAAASCARREPPARRCTVSVPKRFLERRGCAARYVVSVLDSLGYRARFQYAAFPVPGQGHAHPGRLLRLEP